MFVSDEVVSQSGEYDVCLVSEKSHCPASHSVKALFHEPEHMLHLHAQLRLLPVDGLTGEQRVVTLEELFG